MKMPETDPIISRIDTLITANPTAVFPRDRILRLPPQCLRLATSDLQPCIVARRHPLQVPDGDYYDRRAQIDYDMCQDAQVAVPLNLFNIAGATGVNAIFRSPITPGWKLYGSRLGESVHGPKTPEEAALPRGVDMSPDQLDSLMGLLTSARVIDLKVRADKKVWQVCGINAVGAQLEVLGLGGQESLDPELTIDDFGF